MSLFGHALLSVKSVNDNPGRSLDTAFQPSINNLTLVSYSVQQGISSILSAQTASVVLLCDATSTPTTPRARLRVSRGALGLLSGFTQTHGGTLSFLVPAGWYVLLDTSDTAGGTNTLLEQSEIAIGL